MKHAITDRLKALHDAVGDAYTDIRNAQATLTAEIDDPSPGSNTLRSLSQFMDELEMVMANIEDMRAEKARHLAEAEQ